ncbi:MAG TPA: ATP-dependent Clp protease adaptor ClpS [Nitrospirae bacterium]|nr:ATP-dependent Clp protease adaptor ClpS [Nitrospirota bacterium]
MDRKKTPYMAKPLADDETREKDRLAPLYWVVMHNDPVTTMDFVVNIIMKVFSIDYNDAVDIMYNIHNDGLEYITLMPLERAEMKVEQVHLAARRLNYPLTCTIEPEQA